MPIQTLYLLKKKDTATEAADTTTETTSDYEQVIDMLCKETGLSISIDYNYKFLVLIPIEADENLEALKYYYGITQQGDLVVRGIEIRRHDIPIFIKQFQTELLYTLFDCKDSTIARFPNAAITLKPGTLKRICKKTN